MIEITINLVLKDLIFTEKTEEIAIRSMMLT